MKFPNYLPLVLFDICLEERVIGRGEAVRNCRPPHISQKKLDNFREQSKANAAATEVIKTGASPFVSVKVPQNAEGNPVLFLVRVEHN